MFSFKWLQKTWFQYSYDHIFLLIASLPAVQIPKSCEEVRKNGTEKLFESIIY